MEKAQEKRSEQPQTQQQPGELNSFNNRDKERTGQVEKAKDESESYMDYNGNSEANAPARAQEE